MYKVKITVAPSDKERLTRQLPQGGMIWKDYQFFINEPVEEADFWVVCFQRLPNKQEACMVAPENTMFVTWEPDSVYHFSKGFLNQFAKVVSCQQHLKHKNLVKDQPGLSWQMGMWRHPDGRAMITHTYDDFKVSKPEKQKLLSVIASNKAFTKGHRDRLAFVEKLKAHFGDELDLYGYGFNDFANKWDVIAPYKYHIVLENCSIPTYWSEKLADCFLGNAFPFYYGCTNVFDYYNENALRRIDVRKPEEAIAIIEQCIKDHLAEKYAAEVETAKQLVLDKYNFFELVTANFNTMNPGAEKKAYIIKEDMVFFDAVKLRIGVGRIISNWKYRLSAK